MYNYNNIYLRVMYLYSRTDWPPPEKKHTYLLIVHGKKISKLSSSKYSTFSSSIPDLRKGLVLEQTTYYHRVMKLERVAILWGIYGGQWARCQRRSSAQGRMMVPIILAEFVLNNLWYYLPTTNFFPLNIDILCHIFMVFI